jgi:hypothetical protein
MVQPVSIDSRATLYNGYMISYASVSQALWDRGPVNYFFYKTRARGPTNLPVNTFPIFLSLYIKLA